MTVEPNLTTRPRCLAIRPAPAPGAAGGDEVVYRKSFPYLERFMDLEVLELQPTSTLNRYLGILQGNPPETTRFLSRKNAQLVAETLRRSKFDIVFLFNEVTLPMLDVVKAAGIPAVMVTQNVHSMVAATDPSPVARMMRPFALAFERRYYADPGAALVLISQADLQGLREAGITRSDIVIAPAGAPPASPLAPEAPILREAVVTGSYGWWRKRRDLTSFAKGATIGVPIYAIDPLAIEILGEEGRLLDEAKGWNWSAGLRFGLVTDAFLGGFKLKSLEYVAKNCVVLSLSDIRPEFEGLPHAAEFVRSLKTKGEVAAVIAEMTARDPAPLIARFIEFKAACLERYAWERCLAPLRDAAISRLPGHPALTA